MAATLIAVKTTTSTPKQRGLEPGRCRHGAHRGGSQRLGQPTLRPRANSGFEGILSIIIIVVITIIIITNNNNNSNHNNSNHNDSNNTASARDPIPRTTMAATITQHQDQHDHYYDKVYYHVCRDNDHHRLLHCSSYLQSLRDQVLGVMTKTTAKTQHLGQHEVRKR